MASRIIGILGRKQHGKDTFAARLCNEHGFTRLAFADNVRQGALDLDPVIVVQHDEYHLLEGWCLPYDRLYTTRLAHLVAALGWDEAKKIREVRRTLQRFGSESIRNLDPDFWVRAVMTQAADILGPVVLTDVRFPNEVAAVVTAAGTTVRIVNPNKPRPAEEHISESGLDYYTPRFTIPNAGTIEDLHRHADRIASLTA